MKNKTTMKKSLIIFLLILSNVAFAQNKTKLDVTKSLVGNYELKLLLSEIKN